MSRPTTSRLRKGAWSEEEDILLRSCIAKYGEGKWHLVPVRAGLNRCRKSCRLRWLNYLRPDIKRGDFSSDEVDLIIRLHKLLGNRWSLIAGRLPGRTANDVKNYWNTHMLKKMAAIRELEEDDVKLENQISGGKTTRATTTAAVIVKPRPRSFSRKGCWKIKNNATTSPETTVTCTTPPPTSLQPDNKDSSNTSMQYWLDNLFLNAESDGNPWLSAFGGDSGAVENDMPSLCQEEFSNVQRGPEDGTGDYCNHEGQFGSYLFSTDSEFLDLLR